MNGIDFNIRRGTRRSLFLACFGALLVAFSVIASTMLAPKTAFALDLNRTVYCSRTGSKYHYVFDCSGMKNPISMTLAEAQNKGKTPCSNCVHDDSDSPAVPPTSSYYFQTSALPLRMLKIFYGFIAPVFQLDGKRVMDRIHSEVWTA